MRSPSGFFLLAIPALLVACEFADTPRLGDEHRRSDGVWTVRYDAPRKALEFGRAAGRSSSSENLATVRGVRLVLGQARSILELPLERAHREGDSLVVTCGEVPDQQRKLSVPIVLPAGPVALRLRCGLE